jgi:hypothetical protein
MNIFVTSQCPAESARHLDNKRVIKMILESAQMLSTAIDGPYKPTHVNHPCTIWARKTRSNYMWLLEHMVHLCIEYTRRYGKVHACERFISLFASNAYKVISGGLTPFANCTTYKHVDDVHLAYQLFMNDKWDNDKRKPSWEVKI